MWICWPFAVRSPMGCRDWALPALLKSVHRSCRTPLRRFMPRAGHASAAGVPRLPGFWVCGWGVGRDVRSGGLWLDCECRGGAVGVWIVLAPRPRASCWTGGGLRWVCCRWRVCW